MAWQAVPAAASDQPPGLPEARYGHAAVILDDQRTVLVIGGKADRRMDPERPLEVWALDLVGRRWTEHTALPARGPCVRWGHCAAALGGDVLLFGGLNSCFNLGDGWLLRTGSYSWEELPCNRLSVRGYASLVPPHPRAASAWLFGGLMCHGGPYRYRNDVAVLEPGSGTRWLRPTGEPPAPRAQHVAVASSALGGRHMLVAGGANSTSTFTDVFALSFEDVVWTRLECAGPSPLVPRALEARDFCITPVRPLAAAARGHLLLLSQHQGQTRASALELSAGGGPRWRALEIDQAGAPAWQVGAAVVWAGGRLLRLGGQRAPGFAAVDELSFEPALRWPQLRALLAGTADAGSPLRALPPLLVQRVADFLNVRERFAQDV